MWSHQYIYYNIQSDKFFSQSKKIEDVISILLRTNYFKQKNHQSFCNSDNFPWVDMILVETKDGKFASSDQKKSFVNLIAIVCLKAEEIDQSIYINEFLEIADKLNWKLFLEEDDDGNQNVEIKKS